MENQAQNGPAEPLENEESRKMASPKKDEKSELVRLMKENLDYTKLIYEDTQKIRRFMFWRTVINIVWIIVIVAPTIAAILWLPSLIKNSFGDLINGQSLNSIFKELK